MSKLLLIRGGGAAMEAGSNPGPFTVFRDCFNEVSSGEWPVHGTSGTGASVARDTTHAYEGTFGLRHHCGPTISSGDPIARANHFMPIGANIETDSICSIGEERWIGTAFYIQGADPHDYSHILRFTDHSNPGDPALNTAALNVTFESSSDTLRVDLEDYEGSTQVGDVNYMSAVAMPVDQWVYLELGIFCSPETNVGWLELWKDETRVGTRITNRTIKTANQQYRRGQFGLGNYHANQAGREATVWTDDSYVADRRRGPT